MLCILLEVSETPLLEHLVLKSIAITVPPRISLETHIARSTWLRCRYFETAEWEGIAPQWWYGGGTDITPSYIYDDDMKHFHGSYKKICDEHDPAFYPKFRQWCGAPFVLLPSLYSLSASSRAGPGVSSADHFPWLLQWYPTA